MNQQPDKARARDGEERGEQPAKLRIARERSASIDNVLQPILVGRDTGMHELLVFFSMLGGIGVFGVMGFLVGPVIAALFRTLLDIYGTEFNKQLDLVHHATGRRKAGEGFEI